MIFPAGDHHVVDLTCRQTTIRGRCRRPAAPLPAAETAGGMSARWSSMRRPATASRRWSAAGSTSAPRPPAPPGWRWTRMTTTRASLSSIWPPPWSHCSPAHWHWCSRSCRMARPRWSGALERLCTALQEAAGTAGQPTLLVLDDLHFITAPAVHALLATCLEHGPANLHFILLARRRTALPLARLFAHGKVVALDAEDLRFTEEEVAAYLQRRGFPPPTGAEAGRADRAQRRVDHGAAAGGAGPARPQRRSMTCSTCCTAPTPGWPTS